MTKLLTELSVMFMATCSPGGPSTVANNSGKFSGMIGDLDKLLSKYAFVQPDEGTQ